MNLLIITGFLGSGKTTFLKYIAEEFIARYPGKKMAVIENEIGKIGVDGSFLSSTGLLLKEINSGCICCGLRVDFITTLCDIEEELSPELVILEPSGVAGPRQLVQSLESIADKIDSVRILTLMDASRINYLPDITIPIIKDGVEICDFLALNKIDLVSNQQLMEIIGKLRVIRNDLQIIKTSAVTGNIDEVLEYIFDNEYLFSGNSARAKYTENNIKRTDNAIVFSLDRKFAPESIQFQDTAVSLKTVIAGVAAGLKNLDCKMIGHIKAALSTENDECLFVSTTSFNDAPHVKGRITKPSLEFKLIVNVIVYGVEYTALEELVSQKFAEIGILLP
ncbi:MAG: GTP-binding protein [Sedimentisphaeraceae bacterium JB056]